MKIVEGNLLDFPEGIDTIIQNCNIRSIMGAGLALQIKNRYPEAYQADKKFLPKDEDRFGRYSTADVGGGRTIVNIYAQDLYGKNLSESGSPFRIEYYEKSLKAFLDASHFDLDDMVLGIPWTIGSGLAAGCWDTIRLATEQICKENGVKAYWVRYDKKV